MTVRLRPTAPADLDWVLEAEAHPENAPFVTRWTRAQHAAALDHADMRHLVIETVPDGEAHRRPLVGEAPVTGRHRLQRDLDVERLRGLGCVGVPGEEKGANDEREGRGQEGEQEPAARRRRAQASRRSSRWMSPVTSAASSPTYMSISLRTPNSGR